MSLTTTIIMLASAWLAVAAAMLWGVLRITRRHHYLPATPLDIKRSQPAAAVTNA